MPTHFVIPDTQAKPGVPTEHLGWIGEEIVSVLPDVVIHIGDHADMPSLSHYDRGKLQFEGRRYKKDVEAANKAWDVLNGATERLQAQQRANKHKQYTPRRV